MEILLQPSMGFEPTTLICQGTHAYPLSHQGHKETWTRWQYILKVKCEVIKETVSARKDRRSLPWDLNRRPLTLMVHMLIHWAIRYTSIYQLVENKYLRLSVRSLKRPFLQGKTIPWGLNSQPSSVRVHMLIHWAIRDTSMHELVENASLRLSVRSLKRKFL